MSNMIYEQAFCFAKLRKLGTLHHPRLLKCSFICKVSACRKFNWTLKAQIFPHTITTRCRVLDFRKKWRTGPEALCLSTSTPYKPEHFQNSAWGIECYSKATPPAKDRKCKCIYLWLMAFLISSMAGEGILHPCVTPAPQYQSCGHTWNLLQTTGFPSSLSDSLSFFFFFLLYLHFSPHTSSEKSPCASWRSFPVNVMWLSNPSHPLLLVPAFPPIVLWRPRASRPVPFLRVLRDSSAPPRGRPRLCPT